MNNIANNCNMIYAKGPVGSEVADRYPTGLFGPKQASSGRPRPNRTN